MASIPTFLSDERTGWSAFRERWRSRWHRKGIEAPFPDCDFGPHTLQGFEGFQGGLTVTDQRIWLNSLPESFRGYRILHLSDIHHSRFVPPAHVAAVVELSNRLRPDLVALTGDFVTYSRAAIEPMAEMLGSLKSRAGVVAVLGNHDFRVGAEMIERALRRRHVEVLRNRHVVLREGRSVLHVAGVDDYGYGADLEKALRGIPRKAPTVLLAHNPRLLVAAASRGVGLMLSGHTHGGQINLPLFGSIYGRTPEQMRFKRGWDRLADTQIYVSRGIGKIVIPLRFRCSAEIPRLELETHVGSDEAAADHTLGARDEASAIPRPFYAEMRSKRAQSRN